LNEVRIIEEIKMLLDFELEEKVFELPNAQNERISKAKDEFLNSQTLSGEAANSEIE